MKAQAKCKFCGVHLTLEIDDAYAALGDPYNLLKLAACNRCADFRVKQRNLNKALERVSAMLRLSPNKPEQDALAAKAKVILQAYLRMVNEMERVNPWVEWDDQLLDQYLNKPEDPGAVIRTITVTVKNTKRQGTLIP